MTILEREVKSCDGFFFENEIEVVCSLKIGICNGPTSIIHKQDGNSIRMHWMPKNRELELQQR